MRGFSAPSSAAGMRPVLTWKSTAAAPTPIRPGAMPFWPCAPIPWQVAQSCRKMVWPWLIWAELATTGGAAVAPSPPPVIDAYSAPTRRRPRRRMA